MRFAFIANGLGYGGAEKMLSFVAAELHMRGHNVTIFNLNHHTDIYQRVPDGVKIINADFSCKNKKLLYIKRLLFCVRSAKEYKPDIIISFLLFPNLFGVLTGKILGIPSIVSERGDPYVENANNNVLEQIIFKIICQADGAVFQTDGAAKFYPVSLQSRSVVIPNPVSIDKQFTPIDYFKRDNILISLCRLENYQKRLDVLIDSFEIFHHKHPDYVLYIYGSGPDKEIIETQIKEKGLGEFIFLKGVSHNSFEELSRARIFAISSDYEGISNSLLEAMAVGMPVVSTDHSPGGARYLISDGENGLLVPVRDSIKFANALGRFASDESFAYECGQKASKVLDRFSPSKIVDMWENYLLSKLDNRVDEK